MHCYLWTWSGLLLIGVRVGMAGVSEEDKSWTRITFIDKNFFGKEGPIFRQVTKMFTDE